MIYQLLLAHLILLIRVRAQEGSIMITKPPQNQTVCEGDNVTITCGFVGIRIRPNWIIDNKTVGFRDIERDNMLYSLDVNDTNDTALIVLSVTSSRNGTRIQCELPTLNVIHSSVGELTVMGLPLAPHVTVTERLLDSFTIAWDTFSHDVCGDVTYSVILSNGTGLIAENITTTDTSMSYDDLFSSTLYEVSVFATNNVGPGPTTTINVTTLTPAVPSAPRELRISELFINYEAIVWITWSPPLLMSSMPEVEGYNVTLYDEDHQLIFTVLHSQTTFNLSEVDIDLKFRENYTVSISAINSVGYGPPTDSIFELTWLQSAMISLLADNKTVMITCDLPAASPSIYCFVTLNCSQCDDDQFNTISFKESIQLTTVPGGNYVVTFRAVRADNGEPLDDYLIITTLQVPKGVPDKAGNDDVQAHNNNDDDDAIWIYVVISVAVLVAIVGGILLILFIYCVFIEKRRRQSVQYDEEKKKGDSNGYNGHHYLSTPTSVTEKDQTNYHLTKEVSSMLPSNPSDSPASFKPDSYSEVDLIKTKEVSSMLPSNPADSPTSFKPDSYSEVDLIKKHNKTNYVELAPFNNKQPVVMPVGVPAVDYTNVTIQKKQENSS